MKQRYRGGIAILLSLILIIINFNPVFSIGDTKMTITPIIETAVEQVHAEDTTDTTTKFIIRDDSSQVNYTGGMVELSTTQLLAVTTESGVLPALKNVEWTSMNEDIVTVAKASINTVNLKAENPGYTTVIVQVTYFDTVQNKDVVQEVYCQVHVALEFALISGNASGANPLYTLNTNEWRGMKEGGILKGDDSITLQLSAPGASDVLNDNAETDVGDQFSHYLVKIKNVTYLSGVTTSTVTGGSVIALKNPEKPILSWKSNDQSVCKVDQNGIVTAVGAGYATITVSTTTYGNVAGKDVYDSKEFTVLVAPTVSGENDLRMVVPSTTFTIDTNATFAKNLVWTVQKVNEKGDVINKDKNDYFGIDISNLSGKITFTNAKAGVYYITAIPNEKYSGSLSSISYLKMTVIVPVFIGTSRVSMNVGDTYNILESTNLLDKSAFAYSVATGGYSILRVSGTTATAMSEGETNLCFTYQGSSGLYPGLLPGELTDMAKYGGVDINKIDEPITVRVIDGISMSMTSASIYAGYSIQLSVNTSNPNAAITWSSSDEKIAKVDKNGLVTGVKTGDAVITASQEINGVTKTTKCEITIVMAVTDVTLSPSSSSLGIGEFLTLSAAVKPSSTGVSLHWISSDTSVVKITDSGNLSATVQAVAGGTAVISAINKDNIIVGYCLITVRAKISSITLSETSLTTGISTKWFQLYATILPAAAGSQDIIWRSTDPSVLTVDQNGKVILVKSGTAAVIVTSKNDASITAICNITITKSVTGITLDVTKKDLLAGDTFRLSYVLTPTDATNAAVTWSSINPSVATVDATGLVTARSTGSTTIIVKTSDGSYTANCTITVSRTATGVKLDVSKLTLNVGDSYLIEATITPADSTDTSLTWETSDSSVAVVSKRGKVTAKKSGTCIILAKTKAGNTTYCTVTVYQGTAGIEISSSEETIEVGDTLELEAYISPSSASDDKVTWSSNNTDVATVNSKGEVKGLQGGVAIITCTSVDGGYVDYCIVTVEEYITDIKLNETSYRLGKGRSFKLVATISGVNATNKQVMWESSNKSIATVDANGTVKGIKPGTAVITCSASDGSGAEASCEIEVIAEVSDISLNETFLTLIQGRSATLKATLTPKSATYSTPVWSSDNTKVAIVNSKGVITALSPGDCIITAAAADSSGASAICYLRVIAPVASSGVTPQETEVVMSPGEAKTVGISITPTNSTDTYTWSSDNSAVASVNQKTGKITAVALGSANITVMTESGRKATIKVYVVGLSRTYIELQQYTNLLLRLEVDGSGTAGLNVRWDVDNQEIATISNGNVTARALGTTTVYAVVNGRRLACTVKVVKIK